MFAPDEPEPVDDDEPSQHDDSDNGPMTLADLKRRQGLRDPGEDADNEYERRKDAARGI
jgi:hypothetical protein